jgi:putrescine transport system permease protein
VPPLRWTARGLARLGLDGRGLVIAVPMVWLLVFFLIPFLVVAKISVSEAMIARPPYAPLSEWIDGRLVLSLNFENYAYLWDDPLYLNAYFFSIRVASSRRSPPC